MCDECDQREESARGLDVPAGFADACSEMARRTTPVKPTIAVGLEERLVLVLFDLANHLQKGGERMAAEAGLTTLQWLVLLQIAGDPNFTSARSASDQPLLSSEIARERGLSKATISAVVGALKEHGYVREEKDPKDGRRRRLVVTAEGARAVDKLEPLRQAANRRLVADLSPVERERFLDYLERCLAVLWTAHEDDRLALAQSRLARAR